MREKEFICDLCHARVKETSWEHQAAGLYLNVYLPCGNPMGAVSTNGNWQSSVIEYKEVCNDCREAIAAQIAAAVKSRLALAERDAQQAEIDQLREQLRLAPRNAAPAVQGEPVAYISQDDFEFLLSDDMSEQYGTRQAPVFSRKDYRVSVPLYASPQPPAQDVSALVEALSQPAEGEEIMVNTPYDVFTLPLQPSGLSSGPRFVVHVPGPEQPAAVDGSDAQAAEIEKLRAEVEGLRDALRELEEREQRDEALLRQALEALERGAWDTLRGRNAAAAIRARLGEGAEL